MHKPATSLNNKEKKGVSFFCLCCPLFLLFLVLVFVLFFRSPSQGFSHDFIPRTCVSLEDVKFVLGIN